MEPKETKTILLNARDPFSHKGTYGTALLICGCVGMAGAAVLSGKACVRSGVGIARIVVPDKIYGIVASHFPEAVFTVGKTARTGTLKFSNDFKKKLLKDIKKSSAILIGCGMGVSGDTEKILKFVLENAECPVLIDADGINTLSGCIDIIKKAKSQIILTPHPAEMARLTGKTVCEIESDRVKSAMDFSSEYGAVLVLKGHETLIAAEDEIFINKTGNAGMATGGMGDVLSGICVAFAAQGMSASDSAKNAVWIHGAAGDAAAEKFSKTALLPTDVINELPFVFKKIEG